MGAFPVSVGYLREVLEDAYQLNAMPGGGGGEGIEIAQWERCSLPRPEPRAVEDRERSGYARRARGVIDDGLKQGFEQRAEPTLLM
jgi:hypothetical protein